MWRLENTRQTTVMRVWLYNCLASLRSHFLTGCWMSRWYWWWYWAWRQGWTAGKQTEGRGRLRGSLTLTMEPQSVTLIALSDSASYSPSVCFSFSLPPPPSPFLSLRAHQTRWWWQPKCITATSLLQRTPPLTSRLVFFQTSGFKKSTAYWAV